MVVALELCRRYPGPPAGLAPDSTGIEKALLMMMRIIVLNRDNLNNKIFALTIVYMAQITM